MDARELRVFAAVADEGGFTRAAERLPLAQSAVSQIVRGLEDDLGVALFDRSHRTARLTGAGETLLPHARRVLDALEEARAAIAATQGELSGSLTVGVMTTVALVDIPELLSRFRARHPAVAVRLTSAASGSGGLLAELERGRVDVAFVAAARSLPASLRGTLVARSTFVVVVPAGHPLAAHRTVALAELEGESFVDVPPGYGSRAITDAAFDAAGVRRHVRTEVAEIGSAVEYVGRGLGIAVVPRFAVGGGRDVAVLSLRDDVEPFRVWAAVRADRRVPPAAEALLRLLDDVAAQGAGGGGDEAGRVD